MTAAAGDPMESRMPPTRVVSGVRAMQAARRAIFATFRPMVAARAFAVPRSAARLPVPTAWPRTRTDAQHANALRARTGAGAGAHARRTRTAPTGASAVTRSLTAARRREVASQGRARSASCMLPDARVTGPRYPLRARDCRAGTRRNRCFTPAPARTAARRTQASKGRVLRTAPATVRSFVSSSSLPGRGRAPRR